MEKRFMSTSSLSVDSLERDFKKRASINSGISDDNVETILVPFYEKDVLIKVPKNSKAKKSSNKQDKHSRTQKNRECSSSYLVNRNEHNKKTSYLEVFRRQFSNFHMEKRVPQEIRSLSPEFGDTERESIGDDTGAIAQEFYNTEAYNEMYYETIVNNELENDMDNSYEEGLKFTDDLKSKSLDDTGDNLRSVSEVTPPRNVRRTTMQPIQTVKLGGLGPDIEKIRPRLERARSLQRYSEKVRMENRLRIYKKSIQDDIDKKAAEKEVLTNRRYSARGQKTAEVQEAVASYLVNKNQNDSTSMSIRNICGMKSKSADVRKTRDRERAKETELINTRYEDNMEIDEKPKDEQSRMQKIGAKFRIKSSVNDKASNTDRKEPDDGAPVHISFLVNVGGGRPSTALKKLEEKHRMYQERVKAFGSDRNY